jgi:hypothetical protein
VPRAAKPKAADPRFDASPHVKPQYRRYLTEFPEIAGTIAIFNRNKRETPPAPLPAKMKDHVLDRPLKGVRECHLAADVLLLYTHRGHVVHMLYICRHSDLYGQRQRQLASVIRALIN